jgi:hypothetical protein
MILISSAVTELDIYISVLTGVGLDGIFGILFLGRYWKANKE